ncbi:MAG: LysM peptidoglycan-binding domain-containing protein [Pseudomonas sp.]|nr:LysM peptidoglycan-binding domain-containing protein [Pseudomonas sp.]MDD2223619.1 LysM peptidoglycan-binding domain-containing protein [Pseudomonas sp.]MDY0414932.1 LysM peptidoglycan-binding domain-containing protein [Pseudomonas sp.]
MHPPRQIVQAYKQSYEYGNDFIAGPNYTPSVMYDVVIGQEADIWQRVRQGFKLQSYLDSNPRVDHQRLWFASRSKTIETISERSSPYMFYIVESLEARNMPLELALLPMIESGYNPLAYSSSHASGLWQFIPSTGRHFKLKQSHWYDARRDILASTQAALDYLEYLHKMFNNDWLLALAAYNAGEGTVARAIKRNLDLGLPTDYWNLNLPEETQAYVPKLLAVSQLVSTPKSYGITLSPIANQAYFTQIPLKQQMAITRLAKLADLKEDELLQLNPAYKQGVTFDGPKHILVPADSAELLTAQLALIKPGEHMQWQQYRVNSGDSLSSIASRHQVPITQLKDINNLSNNRLNIGQVLNIPKSPGGVSSNLAQYTRPAPANKMYTVRRGDSLSQIAAQQKVSVTELKRWNKLSSNALKVGQNLKIQTSDTASRATLYKVRNGDSLYVIAKRHKVSLKQLKNWNPKISNALKPGQTLSLYL